MPTEKREQVRVRQIKNLRLSDIPTAGGGISRAAYALASDTKLSVGSLLRRANLSLEQAKNPRLRIAVGDQIKFLNLVADELDDEFLGIRLAQTADLREVGLVYYVMASSENLGEALQRVARYSTIQNEGVRIGYRAGKSVALTFNHFGVARRLDRHQIEFIIAFLLRLCRNLSGLSLVPSQIKLMHHRTRMPSEFKNSVRVTCCVRVRGRRDRVSGLHRSHALHQCGPLSQRASGEVLRRSGYAAPQKIDDVAAKS